MKRWKFFMILTALVLLVGADRRLENSRRFQDVKHVLGQRCSDLPALDRVLVSLLT